MKSEVSYFEKAMINPIKPLVAILGGAKVSGKLEVLQTLVKKVDKVIVGGGMAFTFLKALGNNVGKSLVEDDLIETSKQILEDARKNGVKFYLPVDCVVADAFDLNANKKTVSIKEIPTDWMALDIGPESSKLFDDALKDAKTVVWNGPMGVFEMEPYSKGTFSVANSVASLNSDSTVTTIIGGGDTDSAVKSAGVADKVSYISTGGGAFLELLEGKVLPGIKVLDK